MEKLFAEKFFSGTSTQRGKKHVRLTFCDSYITYVNHNDVVLSSFVLDSINEPFFPKKFSLEFVHQEQKNDVQLTFEDTYLCFVSHIDVFKVVLC